MFTDTHCHLNRLDLAEFGGEVKNALITAQRAKLHRIMAIMCDLDEYDEIYRMICYEIDGLRLGMSVGVHPCQDINSLKKATITKLVEMATPSHVWAIGETGLDYYWSEDNKTAQQASLVRHIHASQQLKKPLVVHTREAKQDTLDILTAEKAEHGIIHCFTEDYVTAKRALDLGFYISFSGIVTFKNAKELQETAQKIPLDRILVETDSPYLAPVPKRGKPNQPAYLPYVAQFLADLRGLDIHDFTQQIESNFDNLLNQYVE